MQQEHSAWLQQFHERLCGCHRVCILMLKLGHVVVNNMQKGVVEAVKVGGGELAVCLTFWTTTVTMKQKESKELLLRKQKMAMINGVNRGDVKN